MGRSKIRRHSAGGMLSGIKSKLGFADDPDPTDRRYADDGYEEGYGDYADEDYAGDDYGDYADYGDGYGSSRSPSASRQRDATTPRLVSIDDVRARARVPENLTRDPLPARIGSSSSSRFRNGRARANDAAFASSEGASSAGADSLSDGTAFAVSSRASGEAAARDVTTPDRAFGPAPGSPAARAAEAAQAAQAAAAEAAQAAAAQVAQTAQAAEPSPAPSAASAPPASSSRSSFDPYDALTGAGATGHAPRRGVTVIRPAAYGDVERVAKVVRAGDVAVLSLKATPADLAKRVLDFSFGVACFAEARVDCVGDKTFAIVHGAALVEAEIAALRSQGVI